MRSMAAERLCLLVCVVVSSVLVTPCTSAADVNTTDHTVSLRVLPESGHEVIVGNTETLVVQYNNTWKKGPLTLLVTAFETDILSVHSGVFILHSEIDGSQSNISIDIIGLRIGRGSLSFDVYDANNSLVEAHIPVDYQIRVVRQYEAVRDVFNVLLSVILVASTFLMGCRIEWNVIKQNLKRPYGVIIGICCQFLFMPLLSFGFAMAFLLPNDMALGLLVIGCSPGGGVSNIFSVLQDADLDLSVTMTFSSTLLALGMMPLWLFTFGRFFGESASYLTIPYDNVVLSLCMVALPIPIGMLLKYCKPTWAANITKILRPVCLIVALCTLGLGIYNGLYIFSLLNWKVVGSTLLLPFSGCLVGGLAAYIFKRSLVQIKAIAMETGIQAGPLAIALISTSFVQPEADIASMLPSCVTFNTIVFMLILYMIHVILKKKVPRYREAHVFKSKDGNVGKAYDITSAEDTASTASAKTTKQSLVDADDIDIKVPPSKDVNIVASKSPKVSFIKNELGNLGNPAFQSSPEKVKQLEEPDNYDYKSEKLITEKKSYDKPSNLEVEQNGDFYTTHL